MGFYCGRETFLRVGSSAGKRGPSGTRRACYKRWPPPRLVWSVPSAHGSKAGPHGRKLLDMRTPGGLAARGGALRRSSDSCRKGDRLAVEQAPLKRLVPGRGGGPALVTFQPGRVSGNPGQPTSKVPSVDGVLSFLLTAGFSWLIHTPPPCSLALFCAKIRLQTRDMNNGGVACDDAPPF